MKRIRRHEPDCSCVTCIIQMRRAREALSEVVKEFRKEFEIRKRIRFPGELGYILERRLREWEELSKPPRIHYRCEIEKKCHENR